MFLSMRYIFLSRKRLSKKINYFLDFFSKKQSVTLFVNQTYLVCFGFYSFSIHFLDFFSKKQSVTLFVNQTYLVCFGFDSFSIHFLDCTLVNFDFCWF